MSEADNSIAENAALASEEKQDIAQQQTGDVTDDKPDSGATNDAQDTEKKEEKPQETDAEKERKRILRALERNKRDKWEARQRADQLQRQIEELTRSKIGVDSQSEDGDSEKLTLTKAEMLQHIEQEARKLAPTIAQQVATEEQLRSAAAALQQELGDEFDELTDEIEDILPRGKSLLLLSAKNPAPLVRYLADPDNADEAKSLAAMSDFKAGFYIAELQAKLDAKKSVEKPKPSNAPKPITPVRGEGAAQKDPSQMTDREFANWRRAQIRARGNG